MLGMGSANERRRYYVTSPLIGGAHTQNDPWRGTDSIVPGTPCSKKIWCSNSTKLVQRVNSREDEVGMVSNLPAAEVGILSNCRLKLPWGWSQHPIQQLKLAWGWPFSSWSRHQMHSIVVEIKESLSFSLATEEGSMWAGVECAVGGFPSKQDHRLKTANNR